MTPTIIPPAASAILSTSACFRTKPSLSEMRMTAGGSRRSLLNQWRRRRATKARGQPIETTTGCSAKNGCTLSRRPPVDMSATVGAIAIRISTQRTGVERNQLYQSLYDSTNEKTVSMAPAHHASVSAVARTLVLNGDCHWGPMAMSPFVCESQISKFVILDGRFEYCFQLFKVCELHCCDGSRIWIRA
jgi:hypothetical protein